MERPEPIILEAPDPVEPPVDRITLYLHPTVPEASLCVLRPWLPLRAEDAPRPFSA